MSRLLPKARDDRQPSPDEIRAHLARLLGTAAFGASDRRRKLLAYVVDQTLAGRASRLKGFDLALSVLGRDERFDPQSDPIVRIEVGRLRRDLERYYLTEGRDDPIRITIPKGRYVPAFERWGVPPEAMAPATTRSPRTHRHRLALAAVLLALALGLTSAARFLPWNSGDHVRRTADEAEPAVLVMPLEASGDEGSQLLASGLTGELIATLMRFDSLRVFAGVPPDEGSSELPPAASGARAYIVSGRVVREPGRLRVTARLTDRASEQVLWSQSYDRALTTDNILDIEAELAAGIVSQLAQDYGVITEAATKGLVEGRPESLTAYDCVQRAVAYRRTFAKELYPPVRSCLKDVVRHDPGYADAWAMLAFAHLDAARYGFVEPTARAGEMAAGVEAALHAVALAPNRVRPWQSLAALRFMSGDYDEAERVARHAIALNPNNPESLAQLGWRLMARGHWDEGAKYLQDAIDRSVRVPVWYYSCLASALYLKGDYTRALNAAELGKGDCCGIGHAVLAIAQAAAGRPEKARAALDEAIRQAPVLGRDPRAFWANYQRSDVVIDRLNAGLAQAGLEAARRGTPAPAGP